MAGSATLTTVPSINARLDPSTAATSVQRREATEQGTAAAIDRALPLSHGGVPMWLMLQMSGLPCLGRIREGGRSQGTAPGSSVPTPTASFQLLAPKSHRGRKDQQMLVQTLHLIVKGHA